MKWIIDESRDDKSNKRLIEALKFYKVEYQLLKYKPFMNCSDILEEIRFDYKNERIICYGTINFISKIQKLKDVIPGSFCNFDGLKFNSYHQILNKLLLNEKCKIVDWKDIKYTEDGNLIFIKPNNCKKTFTGMVTTLSDLKHDIGFSLCNIDDNTKVVIAPYEGIEREWRFFVSKNKVITGSQYHLYGKLFESNNYDESAYDLALEVSNLYNPDEVFTVDICKTYSGEYKVVELNSFSCSGLYLCNPYKIVDFIEGL